MTPLNQNDRLEELMRKYLAREQTEAEMQELLDLMQSVHKPEVLEEFFKTRWDIEDRPKVNMIWSDVLAVRQKSTSGSTVTKGKTRIRTLWKWSAAASILIAMALLWWNNQDQTEFVTYTTGFGETLEIQLEDGSDIILNANSELRWNKNWKKNKIREVELQGEAFFEVAHVDLKSGIPTTSTDLERRMPFHVKSSAILIEVLGTSFNVEERRGEAQVYLKEGSVKVSIQEKEISGANSVNAKGTRTDPESSGSLVMEEGETIRYSARTREWVRLETELPSTITEWKDGILIFADARFGDVLRRIEDIYGKTFEVEDPRLLDRSVNFEVPYENWETIEKLMSVTLHLEFDPSEEGKIIIKNRKK